MDEEFSYIFDITAKEHDLKHSLQIQIFRTPFKFSHQFLLKYWHRFQQFCKKDTKFNKRKNKSFLMLLMLDLQSKSKRFYIIAKVSCPNSSSIYGVKYEVPLSTWFYCNLFLEKFFGITFTCFNCSNKAILISMRNSLKMHISPKMYNRIEEINKFSINLFYIIFWKKYS